MIHVTILPNDDVLFSCDTCKESITVNETAKESPFWETYVGDAVLRMLGHARTIHG